MQAKEEQALPLLVFSSIQGLQRTLLRQPNTTGESVSDMV